MKKYDTYKDSGIEWLGEIPEHWEISKLNYISDVYGGATPKSNVDNYWGGNINWITPDDLGKIQGKSIVFSRRTITESGLLSCSASVVPKGSIVLSSRAPIGHIGILEVDACTNQGCKAFVPNEKVQNYFLYYYLLSAKTDLQSLGTGSTFLEISTAIIKNYRIALPPYSEQISIVSFLENKTTQIDTLIEKKEQLVEKLTLKRQAIINEAVTKGLNPNVPMKDSGIEWLGEIPEHWEVIKIKNVALINPTKSELKDRIDDETLVSFLPMQKVGEDWKVNLDINSKLSEVYTGFTYFRDGDIIVAKITPCFENGKGALLNNLKNGIGFGSTEFHVIRPQRIDPLFLSYVLRADIFMTNGESFMVGAAGQKRVPTSFIENFYIGFPSQKEQVLISEYINSKVETIEKTVSKVQESIDKLKLYRQSLISEAVTGKIDLRDWKQTDNK